ncbi:hypothetical protein BWI93_05335 [Siphonobacter sp. BAB-5385]|uniref:hypothetical protein n=1 Tax=Siphonobacter sp. BAB-5385 TaxID=1864822 RepID=UPI000B9DE642|nr:hypothetical protein [Siphonobacter sp. BAB-5385]OZI09170.1 hypothetical protein BWI93_05335 [Siphonobacter sp. BAB-5385]
MCFACRTFREHPKHLALTKTGSITIMTGLHAYTIVEIELRGRSKVHKQKTKVFEDGSVLLLLTESITEDLPPYWYVPFSIKVYLVEPAHEPVFWKDEIGQYNEIRFKTSSYDGILNESTILAS